MTLASLLLRLLLCLALVAGTGVPLPSMASPAGADATTDGAMPCHGSDAGDAVDAAADATPDAPPAAADTCCDGACACQCIVPAVAMPAPAIATLHGLPPARPYASLRVPRASPPVEFPTRPPFATA